MWEVSVNYNAAAGTVDVENPMLWTLGQKDQNENRNIYFNTEATGFTWQQTASDYYRRYLDASSPTGITEEDADSITLKVWNDTYNNTSDIHTVWYNQETGEWVHPVTVQDRSNMESKTSVVAYDDWLFKNPFSGDNHMGVELDANGTPIHLKGQQSADNGVKIVFAKAESVPNSNASNHTVNHIDISISGKSDITVPLAYGTYYYMGQDGQMHEYTVTTDVSLKLDADCKMKLDI